MKKIIPYIFIALIVTSLLAPFSLTLGGGRLGAKANVASAIIVPPPAGAATPAADSNNILLPKCAGWFSVDLMGCIGLAAYYAVFIPTSYLFAISGNFFDFTFFYSVQDTSYRSPFVVQGWGVVRDFVNMFFIFVLLYVAISTILGIHGFKTKEMIINIVIVGLLINFSLFATQVIIDASNILARVFYNSNSITITKSDSGAVAGPSLKTGPNGELPLSAAIVNKVNPQALLINSGKVGNIQSEVGKLPQDNGESNSPINARVFLLVTILASAVNVIGIVVFLSTGLIFISRVIGLWMACIFVPFAFFSYTVPSMQGLEMVGWKHWWPDTLKQAFLAPVFIFFLYLIVKFLDTGLSLIKVDKSSSGIAFVIGTTVPFVFMMMLMWKAKGIATKMSGEMGQGITQGISAAIGLAVGAATGGAALALRGTAGAVAKYTMNDKERNSDKFQGAKDSLNNRHALNPMRYLGAAGGAISGTKNYALAGIAKGIHKIPGGKDDTGTKVSLGQTFKNSQKKVNDVEHARHELDDAKKSAGFENEDISKLSDYQTGKVKEKYNKTKKSETREELKRSGDAGLGLESEDEFKRNNRQRVMADVGTDPANIDHGTRELNDAGKKAVENQLNSEYAAKLETATTGKLDAKFDELIHHSQETVSVLQRAMAKSNTSSYDPRNLGSGKSDKRDGFLGGVLPVVAMAGLAMAVRSGMKSGLGANTGKSTGNFAGDLKETITSALGSINIKVEAPKSGGGGGDHGGGGGHH
ncbi:MAG: hypothetical protein WCK91_00720 [bacterium]